MRLITFIALILFSYPSFAQKPSSLTTELLEHTDRVFLDGYPSNISLSEIERTTERYQIPSIRNSHPSMGWIVNSERNDTKQVAYQIVVASSIDKLSEADANVWNSGKVESDNSIAIKYQGEPLKPSSVYFWKVKTWDNYDHESEYSDIKSFMTAKTLDNTTSRYPLQITDEYPIYIDKTEKSITFVDFGKASFGKLRLTLFSSNDNDTVIVHLGEHAINKQVNRKPGGSIRYARYKLRLMAGTNTYTIKIRPDSRNARVGKNESSVTPIFMPDYIGEVYPFRYCEIENYNQTLTPNNILRQTVHYPFNDAASFFHSSDTVLNKVWDLCKYSIKATSFSGTYVDGDRERISYEADAIINQLCHYYTDREFSMARHSHEFLIYNPTWPTEWNLQSVLIAWNDYLYTADKTSLERCYNDLKEKTLIALKEENGLISTRTDKVSEVVKNAIHFKGNSLRDIVDWPQKGIVGNEKSEAGKSDGFVFSTYNTVVNAYHYEALHLMSRIANALGYKNDYEFYNSEAIKMRKQFNLLLFDHKKGYYKDGVDTDHSSLHANMFPMAFNLVPEKYKKNVTNFIRSRKMACSVYASQFLMDAIYNANDADHGLSLLASTAERSWYNMLKKGSTITMEAWDNKYKPNQDWNHAWGAAPANIIPRKLMGIEPIEPGFKKIRIKPQPATLKQATVKVPSIHGDIIVSFRNTPVHKFELSVEIPANTTAEVWLPFVGRNYKLTVDNISAKGIVAGNFVKVNIASGKHSFVIE